MTIIPPEERENNDLLIQVPDLKIPPEVRKEMQVPSLIKEFPAEQYADYCSTVKGLSVRSMAVYSDTVPEGQIIKIVPEPGSWIGKTATINVYISEGKLSDHVTIPDVCGKTVNEAEKIFEDLGLFVRFEERYTEKYPDGVVIDTKIPVNDKDKVEEKKAAVILYVSSSDPELQYLED